MMDHFWLGWSWLIAALWVAAYVWVFIHGVREALQRRRIRRAYSRRGMRWS